MMKKYLLILCILVLTISACSAQGTQQSTEPSPPTEPGESTQEPAVPASLIGAWKLTAFGPADAPTPAVEGVDAGLTFNEDGTVSGTSGCNGLGGDYSVEGDQITFGEFVSTLMACDDPIMTQEEAAHKVMTGTATYTLEGDTLTITKEGNVLVLTRWAEGSAELEGSDLLGQWKLTSYGTTETQSAALEGVEATLTFNRDGTLVGTSGCNEFSGTYKVDGNEIEFSEIVSTLMLCDTPLMGQEEAMYLMMSELTAYRVEGNTLSIVKDGKMLVLTR